MNIRYFLQGPSLLERISNSGLVRKIRSIRGKLTRKDKIAERKQDLLSAKGGYIRGYYDAMMKYGLKLNRYNPFSDYYTDYRALRLAMSSAN